MANRNFSKVQGLNKEVKIIAGRCDQAGAKIVGLGFSVAKTGTGEYTVTLEDAYPFLLSASATVLDPANGDFNAVIESADVSDSSRQIVIVTNTAATPTDLPASSELHFSFILQNSSLPAS